MQRTHIVAAATTAAAAGVVAVVARRLADNPQHAQAALATTYQHLNRLIDYSMYWRQRYVEEAASPKRNPVRLRYYSQQLVALNRAVSSTHLRLRALEWLHDITDSIRDTQAVRALAAASRSNRVRLMGR